MTMTKRQYEARIKKLTRALEGVKDIKRETFLRATLARVIKEYERLYK